MGHHLISAAFVSMAAYNWHFNKDHGSRTRFATNFASFNVLVFTGYFLDTLD